MSKHTIIVTGWRHATMERHGDVIFSTLFPLTDRYGYDVILREGECPYGGVDEISRLIGLFLGWEIDPMPADWTRFGKAAGSIRNQAMCLKGADEMYAFPGPGSKGTINCMEYGYAAGIPLRARIELT